MHLYGKKIKTIFSYMILKLVDAVNQMSTRSFMNIKSKGHSLTFIQGHSDLTFSNFFSLDTPKQIKAKFHVAPPWERVMKVSTIDLCHKTITAAMSIYGTNRHNGCHVNI